MESLQTKQLAYEVKRESLSQNMNDDLNLKQIEVQRPRSKIFDHAT